MMSLKQFLGFLRREKIQGRTVLRLERRFRTRLPIKLRQDRSNRVEFPAFDGTMTFFFRNENLMHLLARANPNEFDFDWAVPDQSGCHICDTSRWCPGNEGLAC